jgi:glycosidase
MPACGTEWQRPTSRAALSIGAALVLCAMLSTSTALAEDTSAPAVLQMFEARWITIEARMADIFEAGYGRMWVPPPNRASSGFSVGYDTFDRFDLGKPRDETHYGTNLSFKTMVGAAHNAGVAINPDLIWNHNGLGNANDANFVALGGYPGFALTLPNPSNPNDPYYKWGDFHDPAIGDAVGGDQINGQLAGLNDIAQEKNHVFIRHPVVSGNPNNIPAGTVYNKPDPNNARFYPDLHLGGTLVFDPAVGQNVTLYNFNAANSLAGDPVPENATGLLMRNVRWMIQEFDIDGFRLDAARHYPRWVLNFFDQSAFLAKRTTLLDGSPHHVYSFIETGGDSAGFIQDFIRKNISNANLGNVGGNRDVLDFRLFYALRDNLTGSNDFNAVNNWHRIRNESIDINDDGLHNGSQGVAFVQSHDELGAFLTNVAYAYTLLLPGNSLVYLNAEEYGPTGSFPKPGKNDALGGFYGETITKLVDIRNTHGRGNFHERWIDEAFGDTNGDGQRSNVYIYERSKSAVVALSSRNDGFIETRNGVQTNFAPGTVLVELSGNADDQAIDPVSDPLTQHGALRKTLKVNNSSQVNVKIPGNFGHGRGYVIYGVATPEGTLTLLNKGTSQVLAGETPTAATNGTARLADIEVVTSNSFTVQLNTAAVSLQDPDSTNPLATVRDVHADGDTAMIKIDGGLNINGIAGIDNVTPGSVGYGFEDFTTIRTPGYIWNGTTNVGTGSGAYAQIIDTTQLAEGRHYITVRAFRHRDAATGGDGGPAVFSDFKRTIYVDRLPPTAAIVSFDPFASNPSNPNNRDLIVRSIDGTADNMYTFLDLPAAMTDSEILQRVQLGFNHANYYDRDKFYLGFTALSTGNHVTTIVTFEPTGNFSIQRVPGLFTQTNIGGGFGDMNSDKQFTVDDIRCIGATCNNNSVEDILYSQNSKFRAAFDVNGDGLADNRDLFALGDKLVMSAAPQAVLNSYTDLLLKRADVDASGTSDAVDVTDLYSHFGATDWLHDMNVDGIVNVADVMTMITSEFRTMPGDFDVDGDVDAADYVQFRQFVGTGTQYTQGDANLDGDVDDADLAMWRSNFGFVRQALSAGSASAAGSNTIPEASTLTLLSLAMVICRLTATTRRL